MVYRYTLCLLLCFYLSAILTSRAQSGVTMYVNGRFLYSAAGEKVIFRGVNEMFVYSPTDIQGTATLPQIAQTGANVVRICWNTRGSATNLDALLGNCISNKMIPIVQLDDITGNLSALSTCLNYWARADIKTVMNKYKKWVLLNIANEAGDNTVINAQFQTAYISAVSQLRTAGYTMPLVIDACGYGQNESAILGTWSALQQSDPQHNLLFSLHPYWKDTNTQTLQTRFTNLFTAVVANNIPFIIGEGPQQTGYDCNTTLPYSWVMQQCQINQIGWLVWTWGKVQDGTGGSCGTTFDVTTNGTYGSWSNAWGQAVAIGDANSIKNTSVRPPSILGSSDTQVPTTPANLLASSISASGATLTWTASTDNVAVTGYQVYNGTTLLSTSTTPSITLSGLGCNTKYALTVKARDAAGNVSGSSNPVNVTTLACPAAEIVYKDALNTNWQDWSWSANRNFSAISQKKEGSYSVQVNYSSYGGFTLRRSTAITPFANTIIKFWAYSSGANSLEFTTQTDDSGTMSSAVLLNTIANTWQEYTIDMASLGNPAVIKRFNIKNNSTSNVTVYFDYIRVDTKVNDMQPPTAPTNFVATNMTPSSFVLSWSPSTDNVGVTGYQVYLNNAPASGNMTTTSLGFSGITCGTTYNFTVKAFDAAGNVSASTPLIVTTPACSGGETVYDDVLNTNWVDASWSTTNNYNNTSPLQQGSKSIRADYTSYSGFALWRKTVLSPAATARFKFWIYSPVTTNLLVSTLNDIGFASNSVAITTTATQWKEISIDMASLGSPSSIRKLNIQNNTGNNVTVYLDNIRYTNDSQSPTTPTNVAATGISGTALTLTWTGSTDNVGVTGYQVYKNGILIGTVAGTNLTMTGLTCGTSYTYMVKAYDAAGNVSAGNALAVTTSTCADTQAPTTPTTLSAGNITTNGLTLAWSGATDNVGITGYQVYKNGVLLGNTTGTSYAVTGLSCATAYGFSVKAYDAAGNVSASSSLAVTTSACAPVGSTVMLYDDAINPSWTDASWDYSNRNYANTNPVQVGSKSIRMDLLPWGGLSFMKNSGAVTMSASSVIRFWVYSQYATTVIVYTSANTDASVIGTSYSFVTTPGAWTEKIITSSQLGNPSQIKRIQFKNYTPGTATVYFDNIQLISVTGARVAVAEEPAPSLTVFPNPSTGHVQVQYVSERSEAIQLNVVDINGRVLQQQTEKAEMGQNTFSMDLKTRQTGSYLIRLESSTGALTQKLQLIP